MTDRIYIGYIRDVAPEISGMCASRKHSGIVYAVNDGTAKESHIYAFDIEKGCKLVSTITLGVTKGDWEDMACGPCADGTGNYCIYISDDGKVDGKQLHRVYKVEEPEELLEEQTIEVQSHNIIDYESELEEVQTLMVNPSGDMFVMDTTDDDYYLYEIVNKKLVKRCDVGIWTAYDGPTGGDITPDGKGWTFKMFDRIYHFHVENEADTWYILEESNYRNKLPYLTETYGTTFAWTSTGGSGLTCSEGSNEPVYRYYRKN